ncbi:MAG: hypothetical protein WDN72_09340 [Alphaproteobacteria bacterium]
MEPFWFHCCEFMTFCQKSVPIFTMFSVADCAACVAMARRFADIALREGAAGRTARRCRARRGWRFCAAPFAWVREMAGGTAADVARCILRGALHCGLAFGVLAMVISCFVQCSGSYTRWLRRSS